MIGSVIKEVVELHFDLYKGLLRLQTGEVYSEVCRGGIYQSLMRFNLDVVVQRRNLVSKKSKTLLLIENAFITELGLALVVTDNVPV